MKLQSTLLSIFSFVLCAVLGLSLEAQNLVSSEVIADYTAGQVDNLLSTSSSNLEPAQYGVTVHKILYETPDVRGNLDTASGIYVIPNTQEDIDLPTLVYQHGTTGRDDVPSGLGNTSLATIYMASQGYFGIGPDYLGLGEARGFHPYIHADSEAQAAIDMLFASEEFTSENDINLNDQLFITGYSQGGHAAMALHKKLQEQYSDDYTVTASSPMSGPYNVSEIMLNRVIDDEDYQAGVLFLPYVVLGFQEAYGNLYSDLNEIFKDFYVGTIESFGNGSLNITEAATSLVFTLTIRSGGQNPRDMLQDSIVTILQTQEPSDHPLLVALRDNDLYDWVPDAPMRLFYCEADEQVPYTNSPFTDSIMNANGANDVMSASVGASLNHSACFNPAGAATLEFFNGFLITSSEDLSLDKETYEIYPNPASDQVFIYLKDPDVGRVKIDLLRLDGSLVESKTLQYGATTGSFKVRDLPASAYIVRIQTAEKISTEKLIIAD